MADPLADGPEDEKEIGNEVRKDLEQAQKKEKKGGADKEGATHPDLTIC